MFLAPLTARSKVREVLRGLVATRQVHTISLGHAPHFYVAGTLPEFAVPPTAYASSSMPASAYFMHSRDHEDDTPDWAKLAPAATSSYVSAPPVQAPEVHTPRMPAAHNPATAAKPSAARPHFSRPAAHSRDRKPAQSSSSGRTSRRSGPETRSSSARPATGRSVKGSRPATGKRWTAKPTNGKRASAHSVSSSSNGSRGNGNGVARNHSSKVSSGIRNSKPTASTASNRNGNGNGHRNGAKPAGKAGATVRSAGHLRKGSAARKDARPDPRSARGSRKPALAAGAKAGNAKRYGFTAPAKKSSGRSTKKRG